jgi:AraC-like DNA-binding protein
MPSHGGKPLTVTNGGPLPVWLTVFTTREADETAEYLRQMYADNETCFTNVTARSRFSARSATAAAIRADRVTVSSITVENTTDPMNSLICGQIQRGQLMMETATEEVRLGPGDCILSPVSEPLHAISRDIDLAMLYLPLDLASAVAARYVDVDPSGVRFDSMKPVSAAMARYFNAVVHLVHRELHAPDSAMANPLVAEHLIASAAAAVLCTFPNTTMAVDHLRGVGHLAPSAVRRAVAYIDAHAGEPITLTNIAAVAGIGPRALQAGFVRHRHTTPMAYLRRVRLESAHRDLQAADPTRGDTVAMIAAGWGFAKPGRFAAEYRKVFGQSPSRTLRT